MFRFAWPLHFYAFIPLILVVVFYLGGRKLIKYRLQKAVGKKLLPFFLAQVSGFKKNLKFFLSLLCLSFMILAWARPQVHGGRQTVKSRGLEIVVVLDVSRSMLSEDVRPSRLKLAQKEIVFLLNLLYQDKVGLVVFAGSSLLISPLTTDKSALKMFLDGVSTQSVETQGTEIAKALKEAAMAFQRGGEETGPRERVTRVVILISDGEDHEEGALKVAKELSENGIRVFTMALGSLKGGKIPRRDSIGVLRGYEKDSSGQPVISKVNVESLRQVAKVGKGSFYHITFGGSQVKKLREDLDQLEQSEFDSLSMDSFAEKFQWPLFWAFVFGFIELFIGTRVHGRGKWKGRLAS